MRKIRITIPLIIAATLLFSCSVEENGFGDEANLNQDEIAFSLNKVTTRSAANYSSTKDDNPISIDLGDGFYLEESVSSMDDLLVETPETRGIPIYTNNLVAKRENNISVSIVEKDEEAPTFGPDIYSLLDDEKRIWKKHYAGQNPWSVAESDDDDLYFFVYSDPTGKSTDFSYVATDEDNMAVSFSYTSPTGENAASKQEDILFTGKAESKSEYFTNHLKTGIPVTFYHALTAVKFRVGNDNSGDTKTIITGVKFSNLKTTGTCTVKPNDADNRVKWDNVGTKGWFSQTFSDPAYDASKDNSVTFTSGDGNGFADSFYAAAADANLNNADGSLTFFFVPQMIANDVTLEVTFKVKTSVSQTGTEITHTINFGEVVNNVTWNAGELRTYTLKPSDVDVEIMDDISESEKSNLIIANTGNVHEYVRLIIVGNWYDSSGQILNGYTTDNVSNMTMVEPWAPFRTQYGEFDESFTAGELTGDNADVWKKGKDGYFYYIEPIGPGEDMHGNAETSHTIPLFSTYTVTTVPDIYIPDISGSSRTLAEGVHLVMEVVVQAIEAPYNTSTETFTKTWNEAWADALGKEDIELETSNSGTSGNN